PPPSKRARPCSCGSARSSHASQASMALSRTWHATRPHGAGYCYAVCLLPKQPTLMYCLPGYVQQGPGDRLDGAALLVPEQPGIVRVLLPLTQLPARILAVPPDVAPLGPGGESTGDVLLDDLAEGHETASSSGRPRSM